MKIYIIIIYIKCNEDFGNTFIKHGIGRVLLIL